MTTEQIIIGKILLAMAGGMDLPAAIDHVFGEGAYKRIAGEVYHALRAKQGL